MLYDKVESLCRDRGISVRTLEAELGYGNGTIHKWKSSQPGIANIEKVADYFGVSVDYLLGRTSDACGTFLNDETTAIAQKMYDNPGLRVLMDASLDASPEDILAIVTLLKGRKQ